MARPTADHLKLTVRLLDDRIVPTTVPSMIAPPVWWTESHFIPTATAPADNGGIWVVGNTQTAGSYGWWGPYGNDWGLVKLTADNEIDPSFNGGKVKDIDAGLLDWFRAIQVQTGNDGKVYVLARNIARDAVVYSMPTPTIVSDFSGEPTTRGGTTVRRPVAGYPNQAPYAAPFTNEDVSNSILPYPQPTPIDAPEEFFAIVRFNTDGSLDRTFNNDGIALFDLESQPRSDLFNSVGYDVKFDVNATGQIAVAAQQNSYSHQATKFNVARLTSNGNFDITFSSDGMSQLTLPQISEDSNNFGSVVGVHLADSGEIALGGSMNSWRWHYQEADRTFQMETDSGLFVAKLTNDGSLDATFDGDGVAIVSQTKFGSTQGVYSNNFATATDGSYLIAGTKAPDSNLYPNPIPADFVAPLNSAFVVKISASGALDSTFDGDGILYPDYDDDLTATSAIRIVALADGDFVLASQEHGTNSSGYAIARHNADGSLDESMTIVRETPANSSWITDLDELSNGKFVAIAGYPQKLVVIDADGVPATQVTIPYGRVAPWSPPADWTPFSHLNQYHSHRETLADVNGDGTEDRIYVSGEGSRSSIRVVNGANGEDLVNDYQPYEDRFTGGMFVDCGDFDGDGRAEIVVSPDVGGGARVQVFTYDVTGLRQRANFFAIEDPNFRGGGSIGVLDINEDGTPDVVVGAARGGSQRIANFDGKGIFERNRSLPEKLFGDYFAPLAGLDPNDYRDGVELSTSDFNGDGIQELNIRPTGFGGASTVLFASATALQFNVPGALAPSMFDPMMGVFVGG